MTRLHTTTLIRWAGSKKKLLPQLTKSAPVKYNRYIEPFLGSAALFYSIDPERAVLSDQNKDLVNFYKQARKRPLELYDEYEKLRRTPSIYMRIRRKLTEETDTFLRAVYFYYLNRNCFNGLYRTNKLNQFNVPWGTKTGDAPTRSAFLLLARKLRKHKLLCGDFTRATSVASKGDFVYLDPPYVYGSRKDRGEYGASSFGLKDIARLDTEIQRLDSIGAYVLLSYAECPDIAGLKSRLKLKKLRIFRSMAARPKERKTVKEVLLSNY